MERVCRKNEGSCQNKIELWESAEWKAFVVWMTEMYLPCLRKETQSFDSYAALNSLLKKHISMEFAWLLRAFISELDRLAGDVVPCCQNIRNRHWILSRRGVFLFLMRRFWGDPALFEKKYTLLFELYEHHAYTYFHSVRVAILAVWLGIECGYSDVQIEDLLEAALFHDIGKLEINRDILNKSGCLTRRERIIIQNHPHNGLYWLKIKNMGNRCVQISVHQHHERYDGQGYPCGFQAEEIHMNARILAVADVYDALVSDRTYKKAYLPQEAVQVMSQAMGGFFDETLLKIFFERVLFR